MTTHLSEHQLTELLRLAFDARKEQFTPLQHREEFHLTIHGGPDTCALKLFLAELTDEERKDVIGYYYLGRWAFDTFESARENSGHALELIPHELSWRSDLASSVIAGIRKMADGSMVRAHRTGAAE
jgi:hypothetical protein